MDIPSVGRWLMLALAAIQIVYAVRALKPALRSRPGQRVDARLALADHVGGAAASVALAAGDLTALLCALVALGPVMTWQLVRHLRRDGAPRLEHRDG
ncbi:hypothetical protein ACGFZK_27765 [Streptomyces sp. NPDC048257]|uniref:hypothetical protein n=1 Tax=Streptomyces sp. NPDC048257 TaxID=3365526 RepID=UPI00371BBB2A